MTSRSLLVTAALALSAGAACSCGARHASERSPNILLITLDTTRADHLGAYGDASALTPNLDRLASEGVLFERAVTAAPITLPAHVSLLTGRYPFDHGVRNNGNFRLADNVPTLATLLHDRGYQTAAFVSAFVLDRRSGLSRGFDVYDDRLDSAGGRNESKAKGAGELERRGDETARAALAWLDGHAREPTAARPPFFLWIHLYDPHDPYAPPPPFDVKFHDHPYDGEIAFDDEVVGSVLADLDRLAISSTTLVAVVGDHGESLGEHQEETHAMFVYEAVLRVPMIVRWSGHLRRARVAPLVRAIDLAPTLLDLARLPSLQRAQGRSVLAVVRGRESVPQSAYAETYFPVFFMNWAPLRAIQDDRWKLIDAPLPELYDLLNDPHELSNLAPREPARAAALKRALDSVSGAGSGAMTAQRLDRDAIEKLAALGYVGVGAEQSAQSASQFANRPDPKAMIGTYNRLRDANRAVAEGRAVEAEAIARDVLARDRSNAFALLIRAKAQAALGRCRDAIGSYQAYATLVPTSADAHYGIAVCQMRLGEADRAFDEASAALAIDPRYVEPRILRAGLLTERGRLDDAATDYRQVLDLRPTSADAHSGYGVVLVARGQAEAAIAELRRALELRPDLDEVRLALGGVLERVEEVPAARDEYERLSASPTTSPTVRKAARERLVGLSRLGR